MGTTINPVYASLYAPVPGGNPTGNQISLGGTSGGTGANPFLSASVSASPSAPVSTNPYDVPSTTPSMPANTGGGYASTNLAAPGAGPDTNVGQAASSPFSFLQDMSSKDISRLFDSLKKTYGDGQAHLILDFLTSGAGFNQQAINNLFAALQPGIERGTESIAEQYSAMGNRFGSPSAVGIGDFLSQVNLNEGQLETQMYETAINNFMDVMMGTAGANASRIASSPSLLDSILQGINLGGSAAGGASSIISAINPSADTGVLDTIAAAAAFA